MNPLVTADVDDGICILTLNRPDKLNALNWPTIEELMRHLDDVEVRDEVRAVVLTGSGRAFCAGADIPSIAAAVEGGVASALREVVGRGHALTRRIENFPKPIIVAVNGMALGGGCEITEAAPLAVASDRAIFGKPEITLGFPPPFGGSQRLPRHVGRKKGIEMILSGEAIEASEALRWGLVNAVVPHEDLMTEALELARRVTKYPPTAVAACLSAVTRGINVPIDEGLGIEALAFASTVESDGVRDGLRRFLDRRAVPT